MITAKFSDYHQGLLWAEAVFTMTRITNLVSNSLNIKCPDWLWYGTQPTIYRHLVQFGRIGYVTRRGKTAKLQQKALKCVMIGYSDNHSGDTYRLFNPNTKKVVQSRDVTWAEWHGISKPDQDIDVFQSDLSTDDYGIEEIVDDMDDYFRTKEDVPFINALGNVPGTPALNNPAAAPPPYVPRARRNQPPTLTTVRTRSTAKHGTSAAGRKNASTQRQHDIRRSLFSSSATATNTASAPAKLSRELRRYYERSPVT